MIITKHQKQIFYEQKVQGIYSAPIRQVYTLHDNDDTIGCGRCAQSNFYLGLWCTNGVVMNKLIRV